MVLIVPLPPSVPLAYILNAPPVAARVVHMRVGILVNMSNVPLTAPPGVQ